MTDESDAITTLRLRIEGSVQGVGYREFVLAHARELEVDGWIRNRSDGTVEALVSAPNATAEKLIAFCIKGPPAARVANVDMHQAEPPAEKGFRRRPTL
jgi:acylphosphatase